MLGLAWDLGAVTTGPVTVPLVIALGMGVAGAGANPSPLTGFGVVTLASLIPVNLVILLRYTCQKSPGKENNGPWELIRPLLTMSVPQLGAAFSNRNSRGLPPTSCEYELWAR
jgi:hypothetical protein